MMMSLFLSPNVFDNAKEGFLCYCTCQKVVSKKLGNSTILPIVLLAVVLKKPE